MLAVRPVWADSLGAKSFCTLVETPDAAVLIDPGVAIMHGSFPAPLEAKERWVEEGYEAVLRTSSRADVIVITHYHYDHFTDFDPRLYEGKLILAKSPNEYINDSQRGRALRFYESLFGLAGLRLEEALEPPGGGEYPDPLEELPHAMSLRLGSYDSRRRELLRKGAEWFRRRASKWAEYPRVPEVSCEAFRLRFADGATVELGATKIRFTKPMFHGVEFSRVGWVVGVVVEHGSEKLLYTSDVNGPIIEDYADWVVRERPDYLLLDGPATYTLGYMLNATNLRRAVENIKRIVAECAPKLVLLDHHLPREPRFRDRLAEVYGLAEREGVRVTTVAEYLGEVPAVLRYLAETG